MMGLHVLSAVQGALLSVLFYQEKHDTVPWHNTIPAFMELGFEIVLADSFVFFIFLFYFLELNFDKKM